MLVHLLRIFFNEMQVLAMTGKKTEHSRLFDKVVSRFLQRFKHVMVKHELWDYERASYSYYLVACLADTLLGRTEELLPARRKTRFFRLAGNNSSVLPQTQAYLFSRVTFTVHIMRSIFVIVLNLAVKFIVHTSATVSAKHNHQSSDKNCN